MLNDLDDTAFTLNAHAREKGFWEPLNRMEKQDHIIFYLKQLQMINTEVSEVTEAIRKEKGDDQVVEELADILVRLLDLYGGLATEGYTKESLQKHFQNKVEKNRTRPKMHGVLA
jgi:NTP pyrophosphatase (non-canonical NTP hydrolase)